MATNKVISKLSVIVGVNSGAMQTGLATAAGQVKRFDAQVSSAGTSLSGFQVRMQTVDAGLLRLGRTLTASLARFAALTAATVTAGLTLRGFASSFASIDKLAKTAARLGDSVGGLQAFGLATELTGVKSDQANVALQRMTHRIATAAQGSGEAVKALEELGVSAQSLAGMTPTAKFSELADAFKAIEDPADRVRLAFALFDSEGVALVNTLALGKGGLAAVSQEFQRLGGSIGDTGAKAVEEANDAIGSLSTAASLLSQKFAVAVAPAVEIAADALTNLAVDIGPDLVQIFKDLQPVITAAVKAFTQLAKVAVESGKLIADVFGRIDLNPRALQALFSPIAAIAELTGFIDPAATTTSIDALNDLTAAASSVAIPDDVLDDMAGLADGADELADSVAAAKREMEEWASIGERLTSSVATPFEKMEDSVAEASEALRRGAISWETYERVVNQALDTVERQPGMGNLNSPASVGAAVRGTTSGFSAGMAAADATRQLYEAAKHAAERDKQRNVLLDGIRAKLAEMDRNSRNNPTTIREGRI